MCLLTLYHVSRYWRLNLADMLQTKPAVCFMRKWARPVVFFPLPFHLSLSMPTSLHHTVPFEGPDFVYLSLKFQRSVRPNSCPQENKMSLEPVLCHTGPSSLSVAVIWTNERDCFWFPSLRLGRVTGSKGAPWRVVKGAAEDRVSVLKAHQHQQHQNINICMDKQYLWNTGFEKHFSLC